MWEGTGYIEAVMAARPDAQVLVACPYLGNSFGVNSSDSVFRQTICGMDMDFGPHEDYFVRELLPALESHGGPFAQRWIAGASMGGYAALYLGLSNPGVFSRIIAHHPVLFEDYPPDLQALLFRNGPKDQHHLPYLAQSAKIQDQRIHLDCGRDDAFRFFEGCQVLHEVLHGRCAQSTNLLLPGGHDRDYLCRNIPAFMEHYRR